MGPRTTRPDRRSRADDGRAPARRTLPFVKMHGAGNDYVHVDATGGWPDETLAAALARRLADRHFGVGADGLILMLPAPSGSGAACRMAMWNADGSRGALCANGLRCVARHAREIGIARGDRFVVATDAGPRTVEVRRGADGSITGARLELGPVACDGRRQLLTAPAVAVGAVAVGELAWFAADVGNPHAVVFVRDAAEPLRTALGRALEATIADGALDALGRAFQDADSGGRNVEFVQVADPGAPDRPARIVQRTYERGSGETLACGTGAAAAAAVARRTGRCARGEVVVRLLGGELVVHVGDEPHAPVTVEGPAARVFVGEIEVPAQP